jgi:hypothetical protein
MSADSIVMVSPEFFDDFFKPYIEMIGEALGNICLHSCGDFTNVFDNLVATPYLKAVNAGEMTVKELIRAGLDRRTIAIVKSRLDETGDMFDIIKQHNLRVDLSISNIRPKGDQKAIALDEMTEQLWNEMERKNEKIVCQATRCVHD